MDTRVIGNLISLMENSSLSVMDIVEGEFEIHMEKPSSSNGGGVSANYVDVEPMTTPVTMQVPAPVEAAPAAPVVAAAPAAPAPAAAPAAAGSGDDVAGTEIKSPLVGTFHPLSATSDTPDVKVGDHVTKGQVICILEAMKLMNEIESDYAGEIVAVCANDGDLVEYDQVLFKIKED